MKDLEFFAKLFSSNPFEAIYQWAIENKQESALLQLISKLASEAVYRAEKDNDYMKTWAVMVPDMHNVEELNKETASLFNYLFQCVVHKYRPNDKTIKQLEDCVPEMRLPSCFFRPALGWLYKEGIYFKDDMEEGQKAYREFEHLIQF